MDLEGFEPSISRLEVGRDILGAHLQFSLRGSVFDMLRHFFTTDPCIGGGARIPTSIAGLIMTGVFTLSYECSPLPANYGFDILTARHYTTPPCIGARSRTYTYISAV